MTTRFLLLGLLIAASPVAAQQLQTQPPQRWILGANVGGSSSNSDLQSTADWKTGFSAGANVAYRVEPKFAVRADANYAKNDLSTTGTTPTTTTFDKTLSESFSQFGGDVGLGADYNLGRLGLRAEGRDLIYKFDHFGYNKTQNDFIWQGGLTIGL